MVFCRTSRLAFATAFSTSRAGIAGRPSREAIHAPTRGAAIACRASLWEARDLRRDVLVDGPKTESVTGAPGEDSRDRVLSIAVEAYAVGDAAPRSDPVVEVREEVDLAVRDTDP